MIAAALVLVVHLYDAVRIPETDRDAARATADAVFAPAGITLAWRDCSVAPPCDGAPAGGSVIVRIVSAPPAADARSLGFTFVDVGVRAGVLATVFADRIGALAAAARSSRAELLGRAIAHEIAHALLGTSRHAPTGLMRAEWAVGDLQRNRATDWMLSSTEQATARRALAGRLHGRPTQPAALVASKRSHVADQKAEN